MIWVILYFVVGLLWAYFTDRFNSVFPSNELNMIRFLSVFFWPLEIIAVLFVVLTSRFD